eukprot:353727-Chlamydomonas_euryale.AAC.1
MRREEHTLQSTLRETSRPARSGDGNRGRSRGRQGEPMAPKQGKDGPAHGENGGRTGYLRAARQGGGGPA